MWSKMCFLISVANDVDDSGDSIVGDTTKKEIFCKEISVGQSEFYQAASTRFKPEIKLKVHRFEYNNENKIEYDGRVYDVIRTYAKGEDILEITLGGGVNGVTL